MRNKKCASYDKDYFQAEVKFKNNPSGSTLGVLYYTS